MCANPELVFDIQTSRPVRVLLVSVTLALLSIAALVLRRRWVQEKNLLPLSLLLALASAFTAGLYLFEVRRWREALAAARGGGTIVEGKVEHFVPEPYNGHAPPERFEVAGRSFSYSYYWDTPFFNVTAAHGGPIHEGVATRILAIRNNIARLELCR